MDPSSLLSGALNVCLLIYAAVALATVNKARCHLLRDRVRVIEGALRSLVKLRGYNENGHLDGLLLVRHASIENEPTLSVENNCRPRPQAKYITRPACVCLTEALQGALDLIIEHSRTSKAIAVIRSCAFKGALEAVNERLTHAAANLQITLAVDASADQLALQRDMSMIGHELHAIGAKIDSQTAMIAELLFLAKGGAPNPILIKEDSCREIISSITREEPIRVNNEEAAQISDSLLLFELIFADGSGCSPRSKHVATTDACFNILMSGEERKRMWTVQSSLKGRLQCIGIPFLSSMQNLQQRLWCGGQQAPLGGLSTITCLIGHPDVCGRCQLLSAGAPAAPPHCQSTASSDPKRHIDNVDKTAVLSASIVLAELGAMRSLTSFASQHHQQIPMSAIMSTKGLLSQLLTELLLMSQYTSEGEIVDHADTNVGLFDALVTLVQRCSDSDAKSRPSLADVLHTVQKMCGLPTPSVVVRAKPSMAIHVDPLAELSTPAKNVVSSSFSANSPAPSESSQGLSPVQSDVNMANSSSFESTATLVKGSFGSDPRLAQPVLAVDMTPPPLPLSEIQGKPQTCVIPSDDITDAPYSPQKALFKDPLRITVVDPLDVATRKLPVKTQTKTKKADSCCSVQ